MKIKLSFILAAFVIFVIQAVAQISIPFNPEHYFSEQDKDLGGECILIKSVLSVEGEISNKTFEINIPAEGNYYISAWVMGSSGKEGINRISVFVDEDKKDAGYLGIKETGWQNAQLINITGLSSPIKLSSGLHKITFSTVIPFVPEVEFLKVGRGLKEAAISGNLYNAYIDSLGKNKLPENYAEMLNDTLNKTKLYKINDDPLEDFINQMSVTFTYTYYTTMYFYSGANVVLETKKADPYASHPVMHFFNASSPESDSWGADGGGLGYQAKITCTVNNTGYYYVVVRSYWPNTSQTSDLYLYDNLYASNVAVAGTGFRCDHTLTDELNYFTCYLTGNSRLWVESYETGLDGRILGYNENYSGSGDFSWGNNARVKKSYSQRMWNCFVTASSASTPTGTCDLYMRCKNSTIMSYFPNLEADDAIMSSNQNTNQYNCISWSGGRVDLGRYFWPPDYGNPWYNSNPLTAFDNFFANINPGGGALCRGESGESGTLNQAMNFTRTGATSSNACVALWKSGSSYTHGSAINPANNQAHGYNWESKPGGLMRTFHPRDALSGSSYGSITDYYRWDGTYTYGTPPMKIAAGYSPAIISSVQFTDKDYEKLNELISGINKETIKYFEIFYGQWKKTWDIPELQLQSNPRLFAQSEEYENLKSYCISRGKSTWLLIIDKFEKGDELCLNLFKDLTFNTFPGLMDEIRTNGNEISQSSGIIPSQTANWTSYAISVLNKLNSNDIKNSGNDTEKNDSFNSVPDNNFLDYNYPNPFNISTLIRYYLSDNNIISLKIYDILGQEVRTIINNQENNIGWHTVEWNGLDNSGAVVSTGLYIYRLYAGNEVFSKKLIIMK